MALITFKTFDNSIDAHILKAKFESEGIPCYLFDEHIISVNPLYSQLVGGIKLKINEEDVIYAKNVLYEIQETPYTTEKGDAIHCPKCNSTHLEAGKMPTKGIFAQLIYLLSLLLFIFPFNWKKVYICLDCGEEFK